MAEYRKDFKKEIWGHAIVEADSPEEAQAIFDDGDYDICENNEDCEWEEWVDNP